MVVNKPTRRGAYSDRLTPYEAGSQIFRTGSATTALMFLATLVQCGMGDEGAPDKGKSMLETVREPSLRQELLKRMDEDQRVRKGLVEQMAKKAAGGSTTAKEMALASDRVEEVDGRN